MTTRRELLAGLSAASLMPASAAANPWTGDATKLFEQFDKTGRYLPLWIAATQGSDPMLANMSSQFAAWYSNEPAALVIKPPSNDTSDNLEGATFHDAIATIVTAAKGRRVVILNEAHNASRHRAFLAQVLRALRPEGFDTFAAETFTQSPTGSAERLRKGDQVDFDCGYYTRDPVFAEAVREALDLGYSLAYYEQKPSQDGPPDEGGEDAIRRREQAQAENFAALMHDRPDARFLVHVGYGHIEEKPEPGHVAWFAARLKAMTGVDPLTIEQARVGSFGPHGVDYKTITAVLDRARPTHPICVRDRDGGYLWAEKFSTDLSIVHPSLPDIDGRPSWLAGDPERRRAPVALPPPTEGLVLAQALHAADKDPAIPADQYLLPAGARQANFFLRPGAYRIRLETQTGITAVGRIVV
jgi:hypothetical protein